VGDACADQEFALWQRQLARGLLNDENDKVVIPDTLIAPSNNLSALIECMYPDISSPHNMDYFCEHCILAPRNRETNEINDIILDKFPRDVHNLWAVDDTFDPDTQMTSGGTFPPEVLHSATPSGFPQAHLKLKIGCPVIVLRNLHSEEGICNGSRGIVTRISTRVVEVLLHGGETCLVPRIKLISRDTQLLFHLHHRQFLLALSFAITINKSQGQSFTTVGIDLRVPAFAHGQVYVAFSRGRSYQKVKCVLNEASAPRTKNVVYKEAIL
jgi:ATP-dependent exoDNAse (exonuclease V) alpha subunit